MRRLLLALALLAAAAPAAANRTVTGFQEVEDFEDAFLATSFDFGSPDPGDGTLTGGNTVGAVPTHSGSLAYAGTTLVFAVADPFNYSWPAVGGWVRGPDPITLTLYAYDYADAIEKVYWVQTIAGGAFYSFLGAGDALHPQVLTRAVFSSDSPLLLDDFTLGLVDVIPGIPEPADWALLIAGFGMTGGMMRMRGRIAAR